MAHSDLRVDVLRVVKVYIVARIEDDECKERCRVEHGRLDKDLDRCAVCATLRAANCACRALYREDPQCDKQRRRQARRDRERKVRRAQRDELLCLLHNDECDVAFEPHDLIVYDEAREHCQSAGH